MNALAILVGILAALGGIGVVASRRTVYSALCLVLTVAMLAVLFLLLNAQFLFAVQLIIYAGAVMVLFIFIIALLSPGEDDRPALDWHLAVGLVAVAAVTLTVVLLSRNGVTVTAHGLRGATVGQASNPYHDFVFTEQAVNQAGNVQTVGGQLFTVYLLPFEITSAILFVAAIGAVYLTRRER